MILMKFNNIWTEILDTVFRTGYQNHTISEIYECPLVSFITWQIIVKYCNPLGLYKDSKIMEGFWGDYDIDGSKKRQFQYTWRN